MLKPFDSAQSREDRSTGAAHSKVKRHVAPFLILLYLIAFLDRVNVSFASLSMNRDLHISESLFGVGAGIFFLGYLLFAVPSNLMLVRWGAPRWIGTIMILWGTLSASMALVHASWVYLLLRFLLGAAEAGFFPGIILYLTQWLPSTARASLMAMFVISIPLASVIGAPLSIWILSLDGQAGLRGWQWLFLLEGLPAILLGTIVPFKLARSPGEVSWLSGAEKKMLTAAIESENRKLRGEAPMFSWWHILRRDRSIRWNAVSYLCLMIGLYALGFWVPRILSSRGVPPHQLGWFTAVPFAFGAAGMLVATRYFDRSHERRWHLCASFLCAGIGIAMAAFISHWEASLAGLALAALGVFSAIPIFWTIVTRDLDSHISPFAIALINSVGNIGGFVSPFIIGVLLQHTKSYTYGLLFTSISLLLGAAIVARMKNDFSPELRLVE